MRNDIVILSNDNEIYWIEGFGPSEKVAVSKQTKNALQITVRR